MYSNDNNDNNDKNILEVNGEYYSIVLVQTILFLTI